MNPEKELVYSEILTDLFLRMIRGGLSLDQAIVDDGNRVSRRQFYTLKEEQPDLVNQARARAQAIVENEREEASGALAAQQVIKLRRAQEMLLGQVEANIEEVIRIRDKAKSDFVRLQAAQTIALWHERLNPAQPEEKKPQQLAAGRGSLMSLLGKKFEGGKLSAMAPDGTELTITGPKPDTIVENS